MSSGIPPSPSPTKQTVKQNISSVSVKALLNGPKAGKAHGKVPVSEPGAGQSAAAIRLREAFAEEDLVLAWQAYGKTMEQKDPRLFSILSTKLPVLADKERVRVELTSSLQQDDLLRIKPQLMLFLKKELKNDFLELETAIKQDAEEGPRKAFTAAEKLDAMTQKNPALALLRQQFNLDLD